MRIASDTRPAVSTGRSSVRRLRWSDWILGSVTALVFLALYVPIALVVLLSVFRTRRGEIQWDSFSLRWYADLLSNEEILAALGTSLVVGFAATLAALALATALALYVNAPGRSPAARAALELVVFLPFLLPPIITGLSLLILFRELGVGRGLLTITVGHTVFVLALAYRTVLNRLQSISASMLAASRDLGATRWQTFRYVAAPNLRSALAVAAMLAFALSFDETMITLFLVGSDGTLPIRLYAMMRVGFTPEINALVTLILVFSIALTFATVRLRGGRLLDMDT